MPVEPGGSGSTPSLPRLGLVGRYTGRGLSGRGGDRRGAGGVGRGARWVAAQVGVGADGEVYAGLGRGVVRLGYGTVLMARAVTDRAFSPRYGCAVVLGLRPRLGCAAPLALGSPVSQTGAKGCTLAFATVGNQGQSH